MPLYSGHYQLETQGTSCCSATRIRAKFLPRLGGRRSATIKIPFPIRVYEALRQGTETLSGVIAFVPLGMNQQSLTMQVGGQTTVAGGEMVSGNYFQVLGVSPILGRAIDDEDIESGAPNVAVVSHDFWLRELGGEPSAIGRSITVNKLPFTVVGVTPPGFFGINPAMPPDIWISLRDLQGIKPWGRLRPGPGGLSPFADKGYWWCHIVGRLGQEYRANGC